MGDFVKFLRRFFGASAVDDPDRPVLERVKSRWRAEGLAIRRGNSRDSLAAFEARYHVAFPPAVRDYFAAVGGMGNVCDDEMLRFWPLDEVIPIAEEYGKAPAELPEFRDWFLFADYLVCSHRYAVRLTPDPSDGGAVAAFCGTELIPQAGTFALFLERYLFDRKNLILPIEPPDRRWLVRDDEPGRG